MADKPIKYPDYTPIDDPVSKAPPVPKQPAPKPTTMPKPKDKPIKYPDSTPVDEPVSKYKAGGHVHHSEQYGKHAGGHKLHMDHVKAMCGGGYMKKAKK